jgi:putative oxidoreductase
MLNRLVGTDNDPAGLVTRLALGLVMFPHGAQKALGWFGGHGFSATLESFAKLGLPPPLTILVLAAELGGSLLLIVGFLTRLAAFAIGCIMLNAILLVHGQIGFFMNWAGSQKGEGFEYHLLALGLSIALMIKGGGALSVDHAISRRAESRGAALPAA